MLQNASIELDPSESSEEADGGTGRGGQRGVAAATLLQAACDLSSLLAPGSLPRQQDALHLVRFHHRVSCQGAAGCAALVCAISAGPCLAPLVIPLGAAISFSMLRNRPVTHSCAVRPSPGRPGRA